MAEGRSRGKLPSAGRQNKENWEEEKLRERNGGVVGRVRRAGSEGRCPKVSI